MKSFILGVIVTVLVLVIGACCCGKFGLIPANADAKPSGIEHSFANMALDGWVAKHATSQPNPFKPDEATLREGMKCFRDNCSGCHGDGKGRSDFGSGFYPPAPQFVQRGPHDEDSELMYVVSHGIRLTGMPAFGTMMKEDERWKTVLFLKNIDKLQPPLSDEWKNPTPPPAASPSPAASGSPGPSGATGAIGPSGATGASGASSAAPQSPAATPQSPSASPSKS